MKLLLLLELFFCLPFILILNDSLRLLFSLIKFFILFSKNAIYWFWWFSWNLSDCLSFSISISGSLKIYLTFSLSFLSLKFIHFWKFSKDLHTGQFLIELEANFFKQL